MKTKIRKSLCIIYILLICSLPAQSARATGIPVVDVVHVAETVLQYLQLVEEYQKIVDQYTNMVERLELMKVWYDEIRGITNIGDAVGLLLRESRADFLPEQPPTWGFEKPLFEAADLFKEDSDAKKDYERRNTYIYGNIATAQRLYNTLRDRATTLDSLRAEVAVAETNKQILDLTARIAAETAMQQNDIAMLEIFKINMDLAEQALLHDESGRRISGLKEASDVK